MCEQEWASEACSEMLRASQLAGSASGEAGPSSSSAPLLEEEQERAVLHVLHSKLKQAPPHLAPPPPSFPRAPGPHAGRGRRCSTQPRQPNRRRPRPAAAVPARCPPGEEDPTAARETTLQTHRLDPFLMLAPQRAGNRRQMPTYTLYTVIMPRAPFVGSGQSDSGVMWTEDSVSRYNTVKNEIRRECVSV